MRWSLQVVEIELFCRRQQCLGYILFETRPQGTSFGQLFYNISLMYSGMFFPQHVLILYKCHPLLPNSGLPPPRET